MPRHIFSRNGLKLRSVELSDLDQIRDLRNDASTWMQLTDPTPVTPASQRAWFEGISPAKMYFVAYSDENPFIGIVRMDERDEVNRSVRIGADVVPELRGKGHGGRIYDAVLAYCFFHLNCHRVWLAVLETNFVAVNLYKKKGFKLEGRYREAVFRGGKYLDYLIMSILEGEYGNDSEGR